MPEAFNYTRVPPELFGFVESCMAGLAHSMESGFIATNSLPLLSSQQKTVQFAICEAVRFGMIVGRLLPGVSEMDTVDDIHRWATGAWAESVENQKRHNEQADSAT